MAAAGRTEALGTPPVDEHFTLNMLQRGTLCRFQSRIAYLTICLSVEDCVRREKMGAGNRFRN